MKLNVISEYQKGYDRGYNDGYYACLKTIFMGVSVGTIGGFFIYKYFLVFFGA